MENRSGLSFGDNVRVRSTPETESRGIAELRGQIYGETTPSVTGITTIGTLQSDYAINVYFKDRKESVWLAPELVEFLDHGAGSEITFGRRAKEMGKGRHRRVDREEHKETVVEALVIQQSNQAMQPTAGRRENQLSVLDES